MRDGVDIIPTIAVVRAVGPRRGGWPTPSAARRSAREIDLLERLVDAYRTNALREGVAGFRLTRLRELPRIRALR